MKFLIDAQLPPSLARFLTGKGYFSRHVADIELKEADDTEVWDYAIKNEMVIITKDEDFAARRSLTLKGPSILWLRVGNCSNKALLKWFSPLLPDVLVRLQQEEKLIEVF